MKTTCTPFHVTTIAPVIFRFEVTCQCEKLIFGIKSSNKNQREEFAQPRTDYILQSIRNQASLNSVNNEDYNDESSQESFLEESQHVNDLECSSSIASDTLDSESDMLSSESDMLSSESDVSCSSDQSMLMEEIKPQLEVREESIQTIVDSRISFQMLFREYGPYFNNFTEMSLFTWVTKYMITTKTYEDLMCIIQHSNFRPEYIIKNI
ncbi:hypothetical protein F8M41_021950 [Gigaspora margarita]|uniref:Uncharacterized protein n=1 Tax=Gigaspora margarita TaxID=4874 RepID=A0A8H4AFW5_GIGMA|nr:hypothetical protein F8M41_021950 [Gigaspora margarita]